MSKLRSLNTSFWSDTWIETLSPLDKLLFIYLVTNEKTNMLGIYEVSIRKMSFETGIDQEKISKGLKGFERVGKVKYKNNHVIIHNYMKHQNYNTNMKKSAIDVYNSLPDHLKDNSLNISKDKPLEGFERLLNHFGMVRKVEYEYEEEREVKDEKESKEEREEKFKKIAFSECSPTQEEINAFNKFLDYWTESNMQGSKLRFEKQKTFDVTRRWSTWLSNEEKFKKEKISAKKEKPRFSINR